MSKALERREKHRQDLILAAERSIAARGLAGLKTRELAREIGCRQRRGLQSRRRHGRTDPARGIAHAGAARCRAHRRRKRRPRLACARRWCASRSPIAISPPKISNSGARCSSTAWRRASRFRNGRSTSRWICSATSTIRSPRCFRNARADELGVTARSLFSAVHGMVALGLEQKLIAVPVEALRAEIATIVRAMVEGLKASSDSRSPRFSNAREVATGIHDCFASSQDTNRAGERPCRKSLHRRTGEGPMPHTVSTVDPVVLRAARSAWALAASFSG